MIARFCYGDSVRPIIFYVCFYIFLFYSTTFSDVCQQTFSKLSQMMSLLSPIEALLCSIYLKSDP